MLTSHKGDAGWVMKIIIALILLTAIAFLALSGQHRLMFDALDKAGNILSPTNLWAMIG